MMDYDWEMRERKFENDMAAIDLEAENAELREALADLWPRASFTMCPENRESWLERLAELGVEVES